MENATKALLIAAAVLIVIVLIALGVRLLNSSKETSDQIDSTSEALSSKTSDLKDSTTSSLQILSMNEIERFNHQFTQYFGNNVSGVRAKQLVDRIVQNNKQTDHFVFVLLREGLSYPATIHDESYTGNGNNIKNKINDNGKYDIKITDDCTKTNEPNKRLYR